MSDISRRDFLKTGAMALAGITIAPSSILGMSHGHVSPSDKLNIAAVGIGGMGHANINKVKGTETLWLFVMWTGNMQKGYSMNFLKQRNTGITVRCMRKWVNPLMG